MGSVVLDSVNTNFFPHSHVEHTAYHETSTTSSPSRSTFRSPSIHQQQQQQQARPSPRHTADPLMSQRASSGGTSSTSATTGHVDQKPTRPTSVLSRTEATPLEPSLHSTTSPFSPHNEKANAIEHTTTAMDTPTHAARAKRVKVRDLQHIQSFATEDMGAFSELRNRSRSRSRGGHDEGTQYEISEMKVEHIIEMVAGLLTKITSTNDQQHEHLHRQPPSIDHASSLSSTTNSVLAFHGKNIPSITILSYLSRINKYCPTSYEVFLSLLVYFDRMTERVNAGPIQGLRHANEQAHTRHRGSASSSSSSSLDSDKMEDIINTSAEQAAQTATPPASGSMEKAEQQSIPGTPHSKPQGLESPSIPPSADLYNLSHFFVVDSFNIHRLVIAGVTCASKFFSDIFYTNSRYAKVGGLPLQELNHLELQFLLLNDFRLQIPVEEIEAYGTMLVEFYAREVVAQQQAADAMDLRSSSESSADSTATVQATS